MNKYILGIDTTSEISSIALGDKSVVWLGNRNQSRDLLPKIDKLIKSNKIGFDKLEGVVVVNGPGSYTGIRIGVSVANTLGMALKIPVKVVDGLRAQVELLITNYELREKSRKSLKSIKSKEASVGVNIFSLISAGGTRVYGKKFKVGSEKCKVEEMSDFFVGEVGDFVGDFGKNDFLVAEVCEEVREKLRVTNYLPSRQAGELRRGRRKLKVESAKLKFDNLGGNMFFLDEKNNLGRAWGAVKMFDDLPRCKNDIAIPMYLREAVRKV